MVSHPSVQANLVPCFKHNLIRISPIIDTGTVGIVQSNKMTLVKHSRLVDKILNFVLQYSRDNNSIILTSNKSNDLYITNLNYKVASLSVALRYFPSIQELVHYFYIVLNCANVDSYCQLLSIPIISGFSPNLTALNVRKYFIFLFALRLSQ